MKLLKEDGLGLESVKQLLLFRQRRWSPELWEPHTLHNSEKSIWILEKSDDAHFGPALRTKQRINFIGVLNAAGPSRLNLGVW